jgi:hypothetical protein
MNAAPVRLADPPANQRRLIEALLLAAKRAAEARAAQPAPARGAA